MIHPSHPVWIGAGLTDIGQIRKMNQDAFSINHECQLWVLADGMGGHAGGEIASQISVETIPKEFQRLIATSLLQELSTDVIESYLREATEIANQRIRETAHHNDEIKGMGTTVVAMVIISQKGNSQAVIAHAGDSRAYVLRNGVLSLWTKDHTLMEERLALNLITPDQVRTHPLRHVLTKGLGIESQVNPTIHTYALEPTDLLLLCSDGLTKMLTDEEIQTLMLRNVSDINNMANTLITTANRLGGEDNTTVVVIGLDKDQTLVDVPPASA